MATKKKSSGKKSSAKKSPSSKQSSKKSSSSKSSAKKSSSKKSTSKKSSSSRKYSPAAGKAVEREMREMKQGKLRSGSGKKVTNPKQAIAIGLSEARKSGAKVPKKKSS